MALDIITSGAQPSRPVPVSMLSGSHGTTGNSWRMYQRFFGQNAVLLHDDPHEAMIKSALSELVARRPALRNTPGIVVYTKTQTHNTMPDQDWLRRSLSTLGLGDWESLTLSMTNCASALTAVHAFRDDGRPLVVVGGEKAFHRFGNRLSVGLLGEAPVAALFTSTGDRKILSTHVRHLPRFHLNPDDMEPRDKQDLQSEFETEFDRFLDDCITQNPGFFTRKPVVVPYNLNLPLVHRLLARHGLEDQVINGHSGQYGHLYCSDNFQNLITLSVPPQAPVFLFCAGMGVTYASVLLDAARPAFPPIPLTP